MSEEYIEQSRDIYENAESEYEKYYFDENIGRFVLIHQDHNTSVSDKFIAIALAKQGKRVRLLSEQAGTGIKTPDAEINNEIYEFKELTEESRSLSNRVQEGIGQAKKQRATTVIYHINRSNYDIRQINRGIRQAFFGIGVNKYKKFLFYGRQENFKQLLERIGKMESIFETFKERIEHGQGNNMPRDAKLIFLGQILYAVTRNELTNKEAWELEEMLGNREEWEEGLSYTIFGESIQVN